MKTNHIFFLAKYSTYIKFVYQIQFLNTLGNFQLDRRWFIKFNFDGFYSFRVNMVRHNRHNFIGSGKTMETLDDETRIDEAGREREGLGTRLYEEVFT